MDSRAMHCLMRMARGRAGVLRAATATLVVGGSTRAHAHLAATATVDSAGPVAPSGWIVAFLVLTIALYAVGVLRVWRASGRGRGLHGRDVVAFALGCAALAVALLGPLDGWAAHSFAAHMLQHEALMLVAAPLLVCGRPLAAWLWALSRHGRRRARSIIAIPAWQLAWRWITRPLGATVTQLTVLFVWHVPVVFNHANAHPGVHTLQHLSFLASALCFWWAARAWSNGSPGPNGAATGAAIACIFVTMIATGALGALLTFAPAPWYHGYGGVALPWASSALEDQQLGGLLMWVPGGAVYFVAGLRRAWRLLVRVPAAQRLPSVRSTAEGVRA
jgi:putative membrane protein